MKTKLEQFDVYIFVRNCPFYNGIAMGGAVNFEYQNALS